MEYERMEENPQPGSLIVGLIRGGWVSVDRGIHKEKEGGLLLPVTTFCI